MTSSSSHLRPDGTTFPPVTPDPPAPPGYEEPAILDRLEAEPEGDDLRSTTDGSAERDDVAHPDDVASSPVEATEPADAPKTEPPD
jgi:hypothetical protein